MENSHLYIKKSVACSTYAMDARMCPQEVPTVRTQLILVGPFAWNESTLRECTHKFDHESAVTAQGPEDSLILE